MKPRRTSTTATIDNPAFSTSEPESGSNPRHVDAVVSLRDSSIISLARAKVIDADQVAAAWRFKKAWEMVRAVSPASLDIDERIRSTRPGMEFPERRLAAATDLKIARRLLGVHGYDLVGRVCGDGFHIRDIYRTRRQQDTATDMLKLHLADLARLWH